jgi:hypothetical protein
MTPPRIRSGRLPVSAALLVFLAALGFAACGGDSAFPTLSGGGGSAGGLNRDVTPPSVRILAPSSGTIALAGDTLWTRVQLRDDRALGELEITAAGVRGDADLGTQQVIDRFTRMVVDLTAGGRTVTDTVITRVLEPTAVLGPDRTLRIIATARDTSDNVRADTVFVSLASPRLEIASPSTGADIPAGAPLRVRLTAEDQIDGVESIRLVAQGALTGDTVISFAGRPAVVDTTIVLPTDPAANGQIQLDAQVRTTSGFIRSAPAVAVSIGDRTPPTVQFEQPPAGFTVAVGDSVFTQVRVNDNQSLASLELRGYSVRGSVALGTQQIVPRFEQKIIEFGGITPPPTGVVVTRYLLPTTDNISESPVYLVAVGRDMAGNVDSARVTISVGGPRVQITSPPPGASFTAGTSFSVRIRAEDRIDRIRSIRLRTSGAFNRDTSITFATLAEQVDTAIMIAIPPTARGDLSLTAEATSSRNISASSTPTVIRILAPVADETPPTVTLAVIAPSRAELQDSITIRVSGTDNTAVGTVGVTVIPVRRGAPRPDTLKIIERRVAGSTADFRIALDEFDVVASDVRDTLTLSLEVTGFAIDTAAARNCGAATVSNLAQSEPCRLLSIGNGAGTVIVSNNPGARFDVLLVRGHTVRLTVATDQLSDLASDGRRVFASNFTRNRVEVLPIGAVQLGTGIRVGSEPWGLAVSRDSSELFVANSGSTTISRVSIGSNALPTAERIGDRIQTPNVHLFSVRYSADRAGLLRLSITDHDFSDRPQFIAQTASGKLLYSTKPTGSAPDGTLREFNPTLPVAQRQVRLFAEYARRPVDGEFVVKDAEDVSKYVYGSGATSTDQLVVCDRKAGDSQSTCFPRRPGPVLSFQQIQDSLALNGFDAELDFNLDIRLIGLSDTTYVGVSKNRRTVAFGEGTRDPGRIISFQELTDGAVVRVGDTRDLVNNTAERVVGLALNGDGSLGVARGRQAYFFDRTLRLQGVVTTGTPTGGVAIHPNHDDVADDRRVAFVSGIENGQPFIDIADTFYFDSRRRLFINSPVTGALIAVPARLGDPAQLLLRIYAITEAGVLIMPVYQQDL